MIFTKDQAALILAGKQSAILQPAGANIQPGTVRTLRRRVMKHDADGNQTGWETSTVEQGDGEDRLPVKITIIETTVTQLSELTVTQAQWCGHKTVTGCRSEWTNNHPGIPVALLVRFALGDLRDTDRYLSRSLGYTSSPHMALMREAPAIPADEQRRQTEARRKHEDKRLTDPDIKLRNELQRILEDWETETGNRASTADRYKAINEIRKQIRTLDHKLKAA